MSIASHRPTVVAVAVGALLLAGVGLVAAPVTHLDEPATATATAVRVAPPAYGPDVTTPGPITVPSPTIHFLTIEWSITGDADGDSRVDVRYRRAGTAEWHDSMPLRRIAAASNEGHTWPLRHSGSLFDLDAATTYEIELRLTDPDGGGEVRTAVGTTRAVPVPMAGAPVKAATPATLSTVLAGAQPGDVIDLGGGVYGGFTIERDGEPGRPIVVRSIAGAVVNGEIGVFDRHDVMLTGLTVNGRIRFNGTDRFSVTRSTVTATAAFGGHGIITFTRAEDAYIADNVVTGVTPWTDAAMGADGDNLGEGILVTGPGHVIEHNRVRGFRDDISLLEGDVVDQYSIDIVENEISEAGDDGVEADFCHHNCRIVRNRLTNTFVGLSSQPGLGGPTWFVRNVLFNVAHVAFKLYRGSSGDVVLHNTVVKQGDAFGAYPGVPITALFARNNLFLGGAPGTYGGYGNGEGKVLAMAYAVAPDLDFDGYGSTVGFDGRVGDVRFSSLTELRATTTEVHAVQVGLDVFAAVVPSPAPLVQHAPADLLLRPGSAAIDAGVVLPGIDDDYTGTAPDLGAVELGGSVPAYGPRP